VTKHKLVYLETKDVVETTLALDNFKRACDMGRGAVFISIARGKIAEGIDFDRHYGRAVILFGIPYQYTKSPVLKARLGTIIIVISIVIVIIIPSLDFMQTKYQIEDKKFLTFDALRQVSILSASLSLSLPSL
jgi:DNA excision repair protein ERCC-2